MKERDALASVTGWIGAGALYSAVIFALRPMPLQRWEFWFFLFASWGSIGIVYAYAHRQSFRLGLRLFDDPRHALARTLLVAFVLLWLLIFPFSGHLGTWG